MNTLLSQITVNTQNSIKLAASIGIIYLDPLEIRAENHDADYILITHDHYDHFSVDDIQKVANANTILVVPKKMAATANKVKDLVGHIELVAPENHYSINGLEFDTVPAYNIVKPFHPKSSGWVGYILSIEGYRIYVAGDTDATKEAKQVECDIALVPIGGTYTMDAKKAAEFINEIKPKVAIPVHYGSIVGSKNDAITFENNVDDSISVVNKL